MKWTRTDTILLSLVAAVSLFTGLCGIGFGLPATERLEAIFGSVAAIEPKLDALQRDIGAGIAYRSEARDRYDPEAYRELARRSAYFDLLRSYNPDGLHTFKVLADMYTRRSVCPYLYCYGPFYFYQMGAAVAAGKCVGFVKILPQKKYLRKPELMAAFFLCGRMLIACAFAGTAVGCFLIGRGLSGRFAGWFAGTLMAVLPLAVASVKSVKVDMLATFWTTMALLWALRAWRSGKLGDYILAGCGVALAGATKYPAAASCLFIAACHWNRKPAPRLRFDWGEDRKLLAAAGAALAGFILLTPPLYLDSARFFADLAGTAGLAESSPWHTKLFGLPLLYLEDGFFFTWGPAAALLACAGVVAVCRYGKGGYRLMGPFVIASLLVLLLAMPNSESYFLPAVPVLVLWSAFALTRVPNAGVRAGLAAATLAVTLGWSWSFLFPARDVRLEAIRWIQEHTPENTTFGGAYYPVSYRLPVLDPAKRKQTAELFDGDAIYRGDYYIDSSFAWPRAHAPWLREPAMARHRAHLERFGLRPMKTFEYVPMIFGVLPQRRSSRINYFWEVCRPRFTLYAGKQE